MFIPPESPPELAYAVRSWISCSNCCHRWPSVSEGQFSILEARTLLDIGDRTEKNMLRQMASKSCFAISIFSYFFTVVVVLTILLALIVSLCSRRCHCRIQFRSELTKNDQICGPFENFCFFGMAWPPRLLSDDPSIQSYRRIALKKWPELQKWLGFLCFSCRVLIDV